MSRETELQRELDEIKQAKNKLLDRVSILQNSKPDAKAALWQDIAAIVKGNVDNVAQGRPVKETWRDDMAKIIVDKCLQHTLGDLRPLLEKL